MKLNPPKVEAVCDVCGGQLIQRKDDTEEVIKSRLNTYYTETAPIEKFYEEKGLLYSTKISQKINRLAAEVAKDVVELLK
jgi:adenylate kinase